MKNESGIEENKPMRELTAHQVDGVKDGLLVEAREQGKYYVSFQRKDGAGEVVAINFQDGPLPQVGNNGLTCESLLAILIDRLDQFQSGPLECRENEIALHAMEAALSALKMRTESRLARGIEGTYER